MIFMFGHAPSSIGRLAVRPNMKFVSPLAAVAVANGDTNFIFGFGSVHGLQGMRWPKMKIMSPVLLLLSLLFSTPAIAVNPEEILANPALESRARNLSQGLRCLVCQNQSIDDSDAGLARDLRVLLRERLTAGDTDEQAVAYIVSRYGNFVLLKPPFQWNTALLWLTPLLLAGGGFYSTLRRGAQSAEPAALDPEDEARLAHLLEDGPNR